MMYQPDTPLTMASAKEALAEGLRAIASGATAMNLAPVKVVDSAAVGILLLWERAAVARGASIVFYNAPPALLSLAKLYGVFELLHFTTDPVQDMAQDIVRDITQAISQNPPQETVQDIPAARH